MRELLTFHSTAGQVSIINLPEFIRRVCKKSMIEHMKGEITTFQSPGLLTASPSLLPSDLPTMQEYKRITHKLDEVGGFTIPHREILSESNVSSGMKLRALVEREVEKRLHLYVKAQVNREIVKAPSQFLIKDLNFEKLEEMCVKYAENFGSSELYGFSHHLSAYQKFFVLIDDRCMELFYNTIEEQACMTPEYVFRILAKLVTHRPDLLIVGKYEELTYLKEANERIMYGR